MLLNERFAVHRIKNSDNPGFSSVEYSKFKYGDTNIANKYGNELFDLFIQKFEKEIVCLDHSIMIYSSPYAYLPTASYYMTNAFYNKFNQYLSFAKNTNVQVQFGKIDRCQTYFQDYGAMSAKERFELIKNDTYSLNILPDKNSVLLFLDDISITGTHQIVVENILKENNIKNKSYFLYYAVLENKSINPSFENELNYAYVKELNHLIEIILSDSFVNTTRTTKFILSLPKKDIITLIRTLRLNNMEKLILEILNGAKKNNYQLIDFYNDNLFYIEKLMNIELQ